MASISAPDTARAAGKYQNFDAAIYIPVGVVQRFEDRTVLEREWAVISHQLKVDKVYIESERDRQVAPEPLLEAVKRFFQEHGVRTAGGVTLSDNNSNQFRSFCYTDPADRAFVKEVMEMTARHFDEIILDDFFFVTTKSASDIAAKGARSWTQFRLDLMDEAAQTLVIGPAKAVNPKVKVIIKFPNWYEHFQGLGFDLEKEPRLFDGIYTGTETRDPVMTDQFLQPYESYGIFRYFENIAPGRNGGGWVDTFSIRYVDRYAEQLWNTLFAKPPEITLFNWMSLLEPVNPGDRAAWQGLATSFDHLKLVLPFYRIKSVDVPAPTMARVAGASLEQVDAFLGKLGRPVGIASYKPANSVGEDFLHNYLGMIGLPIDLRPAFPEDAGIVLLTESAQADPGLIARIKRQLEAGKSVVITSGLLHALQGRGIEDIVELRCTDRRIIADGYSTGFGSGNRTSLGRDARENLVIYPEIRFHTNDAWALVSAMADDVGYPVLLLDHYGKGTLYVWTIPDNFHHLYRLPPEVIGAVKDVLMKDRCIRLDGPARIALYAYDNNTAIVESYLDHEADVKITLSGGFTRIRDLATGAVIEGQEPLAPRWPPIRPQESSPRPRIVPLHILPHSYAAFAAEK